MAEITKEYLTDRLKQAEQNREQALADANAWQGACVAIRQMLEYLEKEPNADKQGI